MKNWLLLSLTLICLSVLGESELVDPTNEERVYEVLAEFEGDVLATQILDSLEAAIAMPEEINPAQVATKVMSSMIMHTLDAVEESVIPAFQESFTSEVLGMEIKPGTNDVLIVTSVSPESIAAEAGIQTNDTIVKLVNEENHGKLLNNSENSLEVTLFSSVWDGPVTLSVKREGETELIPIELDVTESIRYPFYDIVVSNPVIDQWWTTSGDQLVLFEFESDLGEYFDAEFGVVVLSVEGDLPLKPGDVLLTIGEQSIRAIDHVKRAQSKSDGVISIEIQRRGDTMELEADFTKIFVQDAREQM